MVGFCLITGLTVILVFAYSILAMLEVVGIGYRKIWQVDRLLEGLDLLCLIILPLSLGLVYTESLKSHVCCVQSVLLH